MSNEPIIERGADGRVSVIDLRPVKGHRWAVYRRDRNWRDGDGDMFEPTLSIRLLVVSGLLQVEAELVTMGLIVRETPTPLDQMPTALDALLAGAQ